MQEVDIEEAAKKFQEYKSEVKTNILGTLSAILIMLAILLCLTIEIRFLEIGLVIFITVSIIFNITNVIKYIKAYLEHKKTFETLRAAMDLLENIMHKHD